MNKILLFISSAFILSTVCYAQGTSNDVDFTKLYHGGVFSSTTYVETVVDGVKVLEKISYEFKAVYGDKICPTGFSKYAVELKVETSAPPTLIILRKYYAETGKCYGCETVDEFIKNVNTKVYTKLDE